MARYNSTIASASAIAADTGFAWLGYVAGSGCKLRRVTLGVQVTTAATVPTSQQVTVGINRTTGSAATPTNIASNKMDGNSAASAVSLVSLFGTPPTIGATGTDAFKVAFNTQSGADLPFEMLEEFVITLGAAAGVAFVNRNTALPANHQIVLSVEWEE